MNNIIDGKLISAQVKEQIKIEVNELKKKSVDVGLAVVIVGDNPASRVYVNAKKKACEEVGINSYEFALPENSSQEDLVELINELNSDDKINGILVQLPLPKHINENEIINTISYEKDVDAFHPINVGKIMIGDYNYLPCTPAGVMELIKSTGISIAGKES